VLLPSREPVIVLLSERFRVLPLAKVMLAIVLPSRFKVLACGSVILVAFVLFLSVTVVPVAPPWINCKDCVVPIVPYRVLFPRNTNVPLPTVVSMFPVIFFSLSISNVLAFEKLMVLT